jgi:DNA (cytosine-5)-methyltransferase 1
MTRPRLVDLFCKAGGATRGYQQAGFHVTGVDIEPQPNYCGDEFVQADALNFPLDGFDAIHASPPCQAYTTMSNRHRGYGGRADGHEALIAAVRDELRLTHAVWVIENVPGARADMHNPITLHGGMFGLGVQRPRLFESNVLLLGARAPAVTDPIGVYGKAHDGRRLFDRADGTTQYAAGSLEQARASMGIDWMTWDELRESIPPAYTEHIGRQLIDHLAGRHWTIRVDPHEGITP